MGIHFAPTKGVKSKAYEPPRIPVPRRLSVADGTGLTPDQKLNLCGVVMELINRDRSRPEKLRAWAELPLNYLDELKQQIEPLAVYAERDDLQYERHTHLWGYPDSDDDAKMLGIQLFLAANSSWQRVNESTGELMGRLQSPR